MCGMMHREEIVLCCELGVQAVGVVIEYPVPVPWNLSLEAGRALVSHVPDEVASVVVCSGSPERLAQIAAEIRPSALQVHGDESLTEIEELVLRLAPLGIKVYRALRIRPDTGEAAGEIAEIEGAARAIERTGVAGLVVDSKVSHRPGGTGVPVGLEYLRQVVEAVSVPVIAAGGLSAANVGDVIEAVRPFGVDVLSGIESSPGRKSLEKMAAFVDAVRRADARRSRKEA